MLWGKDGYQVYIHYDYENKMPLEEEKIIITYLGMSVACIS